MPMKKFLSLVLLAISSLPTFAESPVQYFSVGDTIPFGMTKFSVAKSAHPRHGVYIQEYLPVDTIDYLTQRMVVEVNMGDVSPLDSINAKVDSLCRLKGNDPLLIYEVMEVDNGHLLYFLDSEIKEEIQDSSAEFNIWQYNYITIDGQEALMRTVYTARAYDVGLVPFIQFVGALCEKLPETMPKLTVDTIDR